MDLTPTPEAGTIALLGLGLVGLIGAGYTKRKKSKQTEKC
ncbi:MAG: PEP-CTERM sorting domain-containing protein [Candidatus Anammoxibacter sp.]